MRSQVLAAVLLATLALPLHSSDPEPLRIGSDLQLFVDDYLVESTKGVARRLHEPAPGGRAITFDKPWEGNVSAYFTVIPEADRVRLYYRGASAPEYAAPSMLKPGEILVPAHDEVTCYAESRDGGRTFTRPSLGLHEFQGSRDNNIIWTGPGSHNFAPFVDGKPGTPAAARYKAVGGTKGLFGFVSADGIRWKKIREEPIITDGAFDSLNVVFWDAVHGEYVAIYRDFRQGIRTFKCARSKDFLQWTKGEWADFGDAPLEQLYTNATTPYYRAPQILMAFPKRFTPWHKVVPDISISGLSDALFLTSRDGIHWNHPVPEAFIRPGRDERNWVHRTRMVATGLVASEDEIWLYVQGHYTYPTTHLERRVLRTDGFVSLHADGRGGEFLTKPMLIEGANLVLNYATSAAGSIRFEILDLHGHPLPGYSMSQTRELYGDRIADVIPLQKPGSSGDRSLGARPVRLRFVLSDADLYSLQIRD